MKIMKFAASAAIASTLVAGAAEAGEWVVVGGASDLAVGVDLATVRPEQTYSRSRMSAWAVFVTRETKPMGEYEYDYAVIRYVVDCDRMATALGRTAFYKLGGSQPVYHFEGYPTQFEDALPDSHAYSVSDAVCHKDRLSGLQTVSAVADFARASRSVLEEGGFD